MPSSQPGLKRRRLELWGGLECSIVRIGGRYRDQFAETGHTARPDDLQRVAQLGIRTLRYPVLWEHVSPEKADESDWTFHDRQLGKLRDLGVEPVVGLVHHGSGPHYTDLLDPGFANGLARHARRVAERYPWLRRFTPVNEPLTTARFSGLYGHWFPHHRTETSFLRMLVVQCRAVLEAMEAIREIIPQAELVQTEDIGKVFATPALAYQAEYENHRRWLSLDLLCSRMTPAHPFWSRLLGAGIREEELAVFSERRTPPDVVGINHYLTSERYLDPAWWNYPDHLRAANGRDRYADAEAVRVANLHSLTGPAARLREVWDRYHLPIAITEAHHGSVSAEQVRWLLEVWDAARQVAAEGADIRAVTIWSLFGAIDWNSLLTSGAGYYEPGAFDIRTNPPTETYVADAARDLARFGEHDGGKAVSIGWWDRSDRFYQPTSAARA